MSIINNIFFKLFLSALFFIPTLRANERSVQVRGAYFYVMDTLFRDIYSGAGFYSLETNIQVWGKSLIWGSVGFVYASGNSIGKKDDTTFYAFPWGLGMNYPFYCSFIQPYLGFGLTVIPYSRIHNDSPFVTQNQNGWGIGGIVKSGLRFQLPNCIEVDGFLDYTYLDMHYQHGDKVVIKRRANLSGFIAGLGLGYLF